MGVRQDGLSINERSGVMHLNNLAKQVSEDKYDFGIAFDGDADRTLIVDSKGRVIDGDVMLWVLQDGSKVRMTLELEWWQQ